MEKKVYIHPLTEVENVNLATVVLAESPFTPVPPEPAPGYRPSRYRYGEVAQ